MTVSASTRFLHVANGTSTTGTIHRANIPGSSSVWADALYEGPVPEKLSDDGLMEVRARYLAGDGEFSYDEVLASLRAWQTAIDSSASYDELILWFEHDLFDQLNLIQLLSRIGRTLPTARPVSLICIGSFPGRQKFKGLGELTPDELASLLETRQRVTDAQYALAARAWDAFRSPDPRRIEDLLRSDTSALPFLAAALRRHLEEFPSTGDGLSKTERRLLELAKDGPTDLRTAFPRMHDLEDALYIADLSFWRVASDLASSAPPLASLHITSHVPAQLPHGTVALTDVGRDVLRQAEDRVRRCGLDRWLGGVHLQGSGPMWRWDDSARRIVRA